MKIARTLWNANISAEYPHQDDPKFKKQLDYALEHGIPYVVVFGEEELKAGNVKIKDIVKHTEEVVQVGDIVGYLKSHGCLGVTNSADEELLAKMRNVNLIDA